jgi:NAD(P)-dependent dehydrogenase (short-subunit alcohol dehydrogenase family)
MSTIPRFADKVVLITGASRGFGGLAADRFAADGARLVLCDISKDGIRAKAEELRARGAKVEAVPGDVSLEQTAIALVERAIQTWGRLDIALNNAGIVHPSKRLPDLDADTMRRQFDVNVMGVFLGMKHQIPAMLKGGGGAIMNTASIAGIIGATGLSAYVAAKHAVVGLTRTAAAEFAAKGIRINAVCPGIAATAMADELLGTMSGDAAQARKRFEAALPIKRMARPEEIVEAMLFACDPANTFMTGHTLIVDGAVTAV